MTKNRDDFSAATKAALAKRAGFLCSMCRAVTIGPSAESASSITNVGVAAHISAASPGGKRYRTITSTERLSINNGIWLCGIHAKLIDDDASSWTETRLRQVKNEHEQYIAATIGIPEHHRVGEAAKSSIKAIVPSEYAFAHVKMLPPSYRTVIGPILEDKGLTEDSELGMLLCGSEPFRDHGRNFHTPWTLFVNPEWLRWFLEGQSSGFRAAMEIPAVQVYGVIPCWPDDFFEFLAAIVMSKATFNWQRHSGGYLVLGQ